MTTDCRLHQREKQLHCPQNIWSFILVSGNEDYNRDGIQKQGKERYLELSFVKQSISLRAFSLGRKKELQETHETEPQHGAKPHPIHRRPSGLPTHLGRESALTLH